MEHYFTNNTRLKSELRTIKYNYGDFNLSFNSDNGLFSKNKLDYGSRLLVETIINKIDKRNLHILDVGCGYGFIGISLAKILESDVTMCDVNRRALHLTDMNIKLNQVSCQTIESNMYENITGKFDLIVTNPPIRAGKNIVLGILDQAEDYLNSLGELWLVIRKDQGAESTIKHLKERYECEIVTKSKGFYIIKAKKH